MNPTTDQSIEAYPLQWPLGYERTKFRRDSPFKTSFATARDEAVYQLKILMGAKSIIVSTNVPLRQDGLPYANWRNPTDPGVAVYFYLDNETRVICCDYYRRIQDNMQAINKTVDALRGIDRWHCSEILKRSFVGMKALPAAGETTSNNRIWWEVLGVTPDVGWEEITAAYKKLLKKYHPDMKPADPAQYYVIKAAYEQAMQLFKL